MASSRLSLAIVAVSVLSQVKQSVACTAIAVGKDASASGHPIIGHTEDSGPATIDVRLTRVPRKQWPEGSRRPLYNWKDGYPRVVSTELRTPDYEPIDGESVRTPLGYIPQVPETWAYWDTGYGVQNEWGLSIGESTCTARTVGWPSSLPYGHNRAGIEELSKLALERCKTARCAAETMGKIAVEQGFYSADSGDPKTPMYIGSSECLVLADATPGDVWTFNVMTGRNNASAIWASQRMPADHITTIANTFTIGKMNLSDSDNFLYSPGVTSLAEENGWWSPSQEASPDMFDFFAAYGYTPTVENTPEDKVEFFTNVLSYYSGRRIWRVFSLLSPEEGAKLDPNLGNLPQTQGAYPKSVPAPKHSITLQQLMTVMRDHYEGTPYDLTQGMAAGPFGTPNRVPTPVGLSGLWERAISMYRTTWSFALEAKPRRRSVTWFAWDAPHGSAYLPLLAAATAPAPDSYHSRDGHESKFSTKVAFWAFNIVSQYQDLNYRLINADVMKRAHKIEKDGIEAVAAWNAEADKMEAGIRLKSDLQDSSDEAETAALAMLTEKCNAFANKAVEEWWQYAFSLFAKFGRYVITNNESEVGETIVRYPEWWLRSPEVGFTAWSAQGPFHGVLLDENDKARLKEYDEIMSSLQMQNYFWCLFAVASSLMAAHIAHKRGVQKGKHNGLDSSFYTVLP